MANANETGYKLECVIITEPHRAVKRSDTKLPFIFSSVALILIQQPDRSWAINNQFCQYALCTV